MEHETFERLEQRVEELIALCGRLRGENRRLKQSEQRLTAANAGLARKIQLARDRIESMIGRLKSLERG